MFRWIKFEIYFFGELNLSTIRRLKFERGSFFPLSSDYVFFAPRRIVFFLSFFLNFFLAFFLSFFLSFLYLKWKCLQICCIESALITLQLRIQIFQRFIIKYISKSSNGLLFDLETAKMEYFQRLDKNM